MIGVESQPPPRGKSVMEANSPEDRADYDLRIFCPVTGHLVSTGFAMDADTFETTKLRNNALYCPKCGNRHIWRIQDVLLIQLL